MRDFIHDIALSQTHLKFRLIDQHLARFLAEQGFRTKPWTEEAMKKELKDRGFEIVRETQNLVDSEVHTFKLCKVYATSALKINNLELIIDKTTNIKIMTTLKQGNLIKNRNGNTRKVMGVCGDTLHLSFLDNHAEYSFTTTEAQLKKEGYTWDTPAWEPSLGILYWFIDAEGDVIDSIWNDDITDHARRDFLGIYQTEALAEAALLEIRRKLGK